MRWLLLLMLVFWLDGCSYYEDHDEQDGSEVSDVSVLRSRANIVEGELVALRDQASGWPSATDCDGTLWAGLAAAAGVSGVQLELA